MNISLVDALSGTVNGIDDHGIERFICAHAVMLALEGIPGIYIHSLLGTTNSWERFGETGHNRSLNRHRWDEETLNQQLVDPDSHHRRIFDTLKQLIKIRLEQPAFHPNATQYALNLGKNIVGIWRQSIDRQQWIFCHNNITRRPKRISMTAINLISYHQWHDLVSGDPIDTDRKFIELEPFQSMWITNKLSD